MLEPVTTSTTPRTSARFVLAAAVAAPLLCAPAPVPDAVFYNQTLVFLLWGVWFALAAPSIDLWRPTAVPALLAPLLLACIAFASRLHGQGSLADGLAVLGACGVLVAAAGRARHVDDLSAWAKGWWIAGVLSALVGAIQYFTPSWSDGWLIATNGSPGRAVGNMRQPNHLATALLCAMVWTAWLWRRGELKPWQACASIVAMTFAVAMSASRTGAVSLAVLVVWAVVDSSLPRRARRTLVLTPVVYFASWSLLAGWGRLASSHFYGADRLQSSADVSSSRFAIWSNALELIAQNPWTGVGWGNFNFAWTFTQFPDRPVAFFDHTHNLPLQLAVEIGIPATLAVTGLVAWALGRARSAWIDGAQDTGAPGRAALAMLAMLAVHSLLEYPLWYAYFLLPAAWALGLFVGAGSQNRAHGDTTAAPARTVSRWFGALVAVVAMYALWDHRRIEVIFAPPAGAGSLASRIEAGQRSILFGHHADYAAVTTPPRDTRLATFRRPLHQLVDVRLLIATIEALKANARDAEALYAAQRLREFRRPDAQAYFKDCNAAEPPWQCDTHQVPLTWRDIERAVR